MKGDSPQGQCCSSRASPVPTGFLLAVSLDGEKCPRAPSYRTESSLQPLRVILLSAETPLRSSAEKRRRGLSGKSGVRFRGRRGLGFPGCLTEPCLKDTGLPLPPSPVGQLLPPTRKPKKNLSTFFFFFCVSGATNEYVSW